MPVPKWLPRPTAWASAGALLVFATGVKIAFSLVMPILIVLLRRSPRLAWLGMLVAWLSPIAAAAALHNLVGRTLGPTEPARASSWWAGFLAWAVIIVVTIATGLVGLVVAPPPPTPPDAFATLAAVARAGSGGGLTILWLVLAA